VADLTPEQLAFFSAHGIPLSAVFDASGMRRSDYQRAMKEADKSFAFGVSRCRIGHQSLRTRAGHCIQCDHSRIAYMLGYDAPANIYIAGTLRGRLIKVGRSSDVAVRRQLLNSYRYGGQSDWQILASAHAPAAGRVEFEAHGRLARFSAAGHYEQGGQRHRCYELFECDFADAADAIRASLPNSVELVLRNQDRAENSFQFRPRP
jgi:hypothetical protein